MHTGVMLSLSLYNIHAAATAYPYARYGKGRGPIYLDDVQCNGDERSLQQCPHRGVGIRSCGHYGDASVSCSSGMSTAKTASPMMCNTCFLFQWLHVQAEKYVCLVEMALKDELRFVSMEYGEQYVMMDGMMMMPE